jgi:hypothetical protein
MHTTTLTEMKLTVTDSPRLIWNRRSNDRVHCCGERLAWRSERSRRSRKGWLNDVSAEGVSFLIEQRRTPSEGETVEVRTDRRAEPISCRVVRITPQGLDLALVACRRAAAEVRLPMAA